MEFVINGVEIFIRYDEAYLWLQKYLQHLADQEEFSAEKLNAFLNGEETCEIRGKLRLAAHKAEGAVIGHILSMQGNGNPI